MLEKIIKQKKEEVKTGTKSSLISPFDGDAFFTSAINPINRFGLASASLNERFSKGCSTGKTSVFTS